jgi:hypothetical protein
MEEVGDRVEERSGVGESVCHRREAVPRAAHRSAVVLGRKVPDQAGTRGVAGREDGTPALPPHCLHAGTRGAGG